MPQLFVILAALSWGFIAVFVKGLSDYGFSEMEIVTIRVFYAFILLIPVAIFQRKKRVFQIKFQHIPYFFGTGLCSIVFFNWSYFTAMNQLSVSLAVMLLYTSPAFVVVLSYFFLKETLTRKKIIAVIVTIIGCAMISLAGNMGSGNWNQLGFFIGLGAGLGYALYSIFGKLALRHYDSLTVTFYTFFIASLCLLPFFPVWRKLSNLPIEIHIYMLGLALVPTVLAYLFYTMGLRRIESGTASILATVEPAAAILVGMAIYNEKLFVLQWIGIMLILSSMIIISWPTKSRNDLNIEIPT